MSSRPDFPTASRPIPHSVFPSLPKMLPAALPVVASLVLALAWPTSAAAADDHPTAWEMAYARAANAFAIDLYGEVIATAAARDPQSDPGNILLSPLALHSVLTMVEEGARGRTEAELRAALRLDDVPRGDASDLACFWHDLQRGAGTDGPLLDARHRAWVDRRRDLNPDYAGYLAEAFGVAPVRVDFVNDPAGVCSRIGEELMAGAPAAAGDPVPASLAAGDSCIVMGNRLLYSGAWERPFAAEATAARPFRLAGGEAVDVPTLRHDSGYADRRAMGNFRYAEFDGGAALELPCQGGQAMLVLLPDEVDGLPRLEADLSADLLAWIVSSLQRVKADVQLPRFSSAQRWEACRALEAMGVRSCFGMGADLSGMIAANDMFVRLVSQQAWFGIDEQRVAAGAATAVLLRTKGGEGIPGGETVVFHADHPFLYMLRDQSTGAVLFLGRMADPRP